MQFLFTLLFLFIFSSLSCWGQSTLGLELGQVDNPYNQVRIPGDDGTKINLAPSFDSQFYFRTEFSHQFSHKHGLRFLYAPLMFSGDREFNRPVDFDGAVFSAGTKTDTFFKFNSYRATYFYQVLDENKFKLRLGGTLKVRDAEIRLKQAGLKKSRKDLGVVPLFYLYGEYKISSHWNLAWDFDGLIAPQGRAIDTALMGGYSFSEDLALYAGYRILEGGADNDKVYTFSQFNYYFLNVKYSF